MPYFLFIPAALMIIFTAMRHSAHSRLTTLEQLLEEMTDAMLVNDFELAAQKSLAFDLYHNSWRND